jgi:hypothetical protein
LVFCFSVFFFVLCCFLFLFFHNMDLFQNANNFQIWIKFWNVNFLNWTFCQIQTKFQNMNNFQNTNNFKIWSKFQKINFLTELFSDPNNFSKYEIF